MLKWGSISQIGRYTVKPVRTMGMDLFGLYIGTKLQGTHHSENAMISTAHRLNIRDNQSQSNQDILDIVNDCEHITQQLRRFTNV